MAEINAALVKQLREMTGAGMMDCKKALTEADGNVEQAKDWLRKKGLSRAAGKAGRVTKEGVVESYVHNTGGISKVGVLIEVNCESDFVAKTDDFRGLARELALQVAGARPRYVRREEVDPAEVEREKAVYRDQVAGKPENIVEKILAGKLDAFYSEICLLDQQYIRNEPGQKKKVSDLVHEAVAKLGENITVARFVRYELGETAAAADADADGEGAAVAGAAAPSAS